MAAAAYRAGERLHDERQGVTHDYRNRSGVEHTEILLPPDAPAWVQGAGREALWNAVERGEKREDAQTARELRIMIPRELDPPQRIQVVRRCLTRSLRRQRDDRRRMLARQKRPPPTARNSRTPMCC